ncbi:MAG: hypothetical protein ACI9YO_003076 [Gammaproteobacteria bacterium]|jgi:hypothetical protein
MQVLQKQKPLFFCLSLKHEILPEKKSRSREGFLNLFFCIKSDSLSIKNWEYSFGSNRMIEYQRRLLT